MSRAPLEYGAGGGYIATVDSRPLPSAKSTLRRHTDKPKILEGYACIYNVIHNHKNRREIFSPGCFNGSLFGVMFKIDHQFASKKLGDQDDNTLELFDCDIGLAFRLKLGPDALDRLDGRD